MTTEYHWSGWSLTSEERSASDVRTYVATLAHFDGTSSTLGTPAFYTHDHLGSTRGLYDSGENLLGQQEFTPYGKIYLDGMPNETMAFTGHQRDTLTGDYYAPYRYYSPALARWLKRDPLGMVNGPNMYAYVGGNPPNFIDPLGLDYLTFDGEQLTWVFEETRVAISELGASTYQVETGRKSWAANTGGPSGDPIPPGRYTTSPHDKEYHPGNETAWGPFSYRLHEGLLTRIRNRLNGRTGGFHIHGGFRVGTAGCIEFGEYDSEQEFLHEFDTLMQNYGHTISVYVKY